MPDDYYPRRTYSVLTETLSAQLERLRAGLWRPDLGSLRGAAMLACVEEMEAEGVLVPDGGALLSRAHACETGRVFYEIGIQHLEVGDGLRKAGWSGRRADVPPD